MRLRFSVGDSQISGCVQPALVVIALVAACFVGCGESGPELIPVVGKVLIDGRPAAEGVVTYRKASSNDFEASGIIQPDGTYKLMQNNRDGATVGEYRVVVFVRQTPKDSKGEMAALPSIVVNKRFTDPKTTPLKVEVTKEAPAGHYNLAVTR